MKATPSSEVVCALDGLATEIRTLRGDGTRMGELIAIRERLNEMGCAISVTGLIQWFPVREQLDLLNAYVPGGTS